MEIKKHYTPQLLTYNQSQFFSLLAKTSNLNIRVLDAIMFKKDSNTHKSASLWYYTDQNSQFNFRDLQAMEIHELVTIILCNINGTKELTHSSLVVTPLTIKQ